MNVRRFYYYTGPVVADDADVMSDADQQAAKELVRKMHRLRQSIERGPTGRLSPEAEKRIDNELQRRAYAGRTALVRVMQCSKSDLDDIDATVFDALPDILLIEQH